MADSGVFGPPAVKITQIPKTPNIIDAVIKILVAIFCIISLYQLNRCICCI